MAFKLPPLPVGVPPGHDYWNDWYEKLRQLFEAATGGFQNLTEKNAANGYAGLNSVSRVTKGIDTQDDVVIDLDTKGLVLKSPNAHYWRATISNAGTVTWTDLGTTKP